MMTICIAGKNNIAVDILDYLIHFKHIDKSSILVCCNKNESGENHWQRSLRMKANQLEIKEIKLEELYDIEDLVFISLEFDRIIKLEKFKSKKLFNIHFSLLPAYKGMHTSVFPILNNDTEAGVTFHKIDNGIDTGEIIAQKKFKLGYNDTSRDLYFKSIKYGTSLVKDCIDKYLPNNFDCNSKPQKILKSTYHSKSDIDYSAITINLNQTALNIHNQIRAFCFREYQIPTLFGRNVIHSRILPLRSVEKPGTVLFQDRYMFTVSTIDYDMVIYYDMFDELMDYCRNNTIAEIEKLPLLEAYVNQTDKNGWTPLIVATYNGHYELAMKLIAEGADIRAVNRNGTNLLMYSKDSFIKTNDSRLFEYYHKKGISIYQEDFNGKNLVYYCLNQGLYCIGNIKIADKQRTG